MAHTHKQTEIYHTANGSTTTFSYPFEYYQKTDVHVTVNGTAKTQGTHYDVTGTNVVFKTSPTDYTPANNDVVRVYRDTDVNTSKATFAAGSTIRATDLNNNETQLLFAAQENADQLIAAGDIKDGEVTTAKLKDGAVTAAKIGANALTYAKIQNVSATNRVLGRDTSGAGIIEEITPANLRTMINVEDGATADQTNDEIRQAIGNASDSNIFTDADHSKLDGIAAGAEVNVKPDWNASSGDAQILNKPTIPAAQVKADWNSSSGISEILNKPTILELIDEDNFVSDSATKPPSQQSTKAYIASTSQPLDSELTTLAGMPGATASILADSTALTSTTAELNLLDGKSIVTSVSGSSTNVQLPTAKAVNDAIAGINTDAGNFVPIADELKFPNTNPDPGGNAGTIVSIAYAGGIVVNGSGVSTTGRTLGGSTVTINGIDSSLHNTTIAAGKGMLVQTTSTLNTYDYHRLVVDEAGVASAQSLVSDFNDRYQVASSAPSNHPDGSALQDGDLWFDTTANEMKVYDLGNTTYATVTSVGNFYINTISSYSGTGGNSASFNGTAYRFTLSNAGSNAEQHIVSINGVIQKPNSGTGQPSEGFAINSGSIVFSSPPASGADYFIITIGAAVNIGTPSNNAVSTVTIQNGAVTTAKLGDQAVDLTKIVHGTSDNNGKFLRANNGADPTWETVSTTPEGTAILSTGESGGTKFLREDGDGTSSWQAVPAGVTQENVEDWVGDMVTGNTETGITVTYDDSDGTLDFVVADQTPTTTRGDIIYRAASADARLAKGTEGQYLKQGANDPEWADVVGAVADGCIFENDQTISNNYTIASGKGAHSVGPITVNATVTVNGNWVVS